MTQKDPDAAKSADGESSPDTRQKIEVSPLMLEHVREVRENLRIAIEKRGKNHRFDPRANASGIPDLRKDPDWKKNLAKRKSLSLDTSVADETFLLNSDAPGIVKTIIRTSDGVERITSQAEVSPGARVSISLKPLKFSGPLTADVVFQPADGGATKKLKIPLGDLSAAVDEPNPQPAPAPAAVIAPDLGTPRELTEIPVLPASERLVIIGLDGKQIIEPAAAGEQEPANVEGRLDGKLLYLKVSKAGMFKADVFVPGETKRSNANQAGPANAGQEMRIPVGFLLDTLPLRVVITLTPFDGSPAFTKTLMVDPRNVGSEVA